MNMLSTEVTDRGWTITQDGTNRDGWSVQGLSCGEIWFFPKEKIGDDYPKSPTDQHNEYYQIQDVLWDRRHELGRCLDKGDEVR
jgi:hypothetical protein